MEHSEENRTINRLSKPRYTPRLAFCRSDLILIFCIAVLALLPFAIGKYQQVRADAQKSGLTAVLTVDGKEVWSEDLDGLTSEITYSVEIGTQRLTICADADGAWVETSDCSDQICVHTGKLGKVGKVAVCIPFRVVLRIVAANPSQRDIEPEKIDAVSGNCGGLYEKFYG
jgi:hypothetical protein